MKITTVFIDEDNYKKLKHKAIGNSTNIKIEVNKAIENYVNEDTKKSSHDNNPDNQDNQKPVDIKEDKENHIEIKQTKIESGGKNGRNQEPEQREPEPREPKTREPKKKPREPKTEPRKDKPNHTEGEVTRTPASPTSRYWR